MEEQPRARPLLILFTKSALLSTAEFHLALSLIVSHYMYNYPPGYDPTIRLGQCGVLVAGFAVIWIYWKCHQPNYVFFMIVFAK